LNHCRLDCSSAVPMKPPSVQRKLAPLVPRLCVACSALCVCGYACGTQGPWKATNAPAIMRASRNAPAIIRSSRAAGPRGSSAAQPPPSRPSLPPSFRWTRQVRNRPPLARRATCGHSGAWPSCSRDA
jgi:hypothetical protein